MCYKVSSLLNAKIPRTEINALQLHADEKSLHEVLLSIPRITHKILWEIRTSIVQKVCMYRYKYTHLRGHSHMVLDADIGTDVKAFIDSVHFMLTCARSIKFIGIPSFGRQKLLP